MKQYIREAKENPIGALLASLWIVGGAAGGLLSLYIIGTIIGKVLSFLLFF